MQLPQSTQELVTAEKPRVGLVLYDVPNAHEAVVRHEPHEVGMHAVAPQVDPADDPADQRIPVRQMQKPKALLDRLPGLHRHRAADASGCRGYRELDG